MMTVMTVMILTMIIMMTVFNSVLAMMIMITMINVWIDTAKFCDKFHLQAISVNIILIFLNL